MDAWKSRSNDQALAEMSLDDVKNIVAANPDNQHAKDLLARKMTKERSGQTETVMEYLKAFTHEVVSAEDVVRIYSKIKKMREGEGGRGSVSDGRDVQLDALYRYVNSRGVLNQYTKQSAYVPEDLPIWMWRLIIIGCHQRG